MTRFTLLALSLSILSTAHAQDADILRDLAPRACETPKACVKACDSGDVQACVELARIYSVGESSWARSTNLAHDACVQHQHVDACLIADRLDAFPESDSTLHATLEEACMRGSAKGCTELAQATTDADAAEQLLERALHIYAERCESGDGVACSEARVVHEDAEESDASKVAYYTEKGVEIFLAACEADDPRGCFALSDAYQEGLISGEPDDVERLAEEYGARAFALYAAECEKGSATACFNTYTLAELEYAEDVDAEALVEQACALGHARACAQIDALEDLTDEALRLDCKLGHSDACLDGARHAEARGSEKDADALYDTACKSGSSIACDEFGNRHYSAGRFTKARTIFEKGCELGNPDACWNAGQVAHQEKDGKRVVALFSRACDALDHADSCDNLVDLYSGDPDDPDLLVRPDSKRAATYQKRACALDPMYCQP